MRLQILILILCLVSPQFSYADSNKEFFMSATYGVLAGTLVGAASLAFTDKPGDNLNKIARGASFGLYAGMILGAYIVWGVPSGDEDDTEKRQGPAPEESNEDDQGSLKPMVMPLFSQNGIDGAFLAMKVLSF